MLSGAGEIMINLLVYKLDGGLELQVLVDLIVVSGLPLGFVDSVQMAGLFVAVTFGYFIACFFFAHFSYLNSSKPNYLKKSV